MNSQEWQIAGKALEAYSAEKPEWVQTGLRAINRWGSAEVTLQQAIAEALEEAYAMGVNGTPPVYAPHVETPTGVIRRSRPAAQVEEPVSTPIRIRRTR